MISSHGISTLTMYLYTGHSASTSLGKGLGVDEESNKKWYRRDGLQSRKSEWTISVTRSLFPLVFSWGSDNTIASNKNSTSKKEPTSAPEITIQHLHKNIVIPLLFQCVLFLHTCVSKNSVVPEHVIFYLLWYNVIRRSRHICKTVFFSLIL